MPPDAPAPAGAQRTSTPPEAAAAATASTPEAPPLAPPRALQRSLRLPPAEGFEERTIPAGPRGLVTLLVPAKNEEQGIGATLRALPLRTLEAQGFGHDVVVLDGNSVDRTRDLAVAWGARVLGQGAPGKGNAVRGARASLQGDFVVMLDGDSTYAADAIPRVLEALERGGADVVMGSRLRGRVAPGAMSRVNRLGNLLLSALASLLYMRLCTDVCTGLWGFRAQALRSLPLESRGFELEAELFARAARAGLKVVEVPVDYMPRRGGTKLSRTRDGLRIGWMLVRTRFAPPAGPPAAPSMLPGRRQGAQP